MELLTGLEAQSYVQGLVHEKTQVGAFWLDLTVAAVQRLTKRGTLDFGGSEFSAAESLPLRSNKRRDDDKYGWWELGDGMYRVIFNEQLNKLPDDHAAFLAPHPRLISAGASHTSSYFFQGDDLSAVVNVPQAGCALKQNCRVSRLQVFKLR
jgi:dUTP diphosphatase